MAWVIAHTLAKRAMKYPRPALPLPIDYVVYIEDAIYKALNCKTGEIEFSDTDAIVVLQEVLNALGAAGGGHVKLGVGTFTGAGTLTLPAVRGSYIIEGSGYSYVQTPPAEGVFPATVIETTGNGPVLEGRYLVPAAHLYLKQLNLRVSGDTPVGAVNLWYIQSITIEQVTVQWKNYSEVSPPPSPPPTGSYGFRIPTVSMNIASFRDVYVCFLDIGMDISAGDHVLVEHIQFLGCGSRCADISGGFTQTFIRAHAFR